MSIFGYKIRLAFLLTFIGILFGTTGYRYIADYSWLEAFYMTVITSSTVGFHEVRPTDDVTKGFTIFLIAYSIFTFAFLGSVITEYIFSNNSFEKLTKRKMINTIKKLNQHTIICGYGKMGKETAHVLSSYGNKIVIIEKDAKKVEGDSKNITFLIGNASDEDILKQAGITKAKNLISTLSNDAENLFIVLSSKQINQNIKIISRVSRKGSESKLKFAGADKTVLADIISGNHMAFLLLFPSLKNFMEILSANENQSPCIEEMEITSKMLSNGKKTLIDLDLRKQTGCNVIGLITPQNEYVINPDSDTELKPNSKIIVVGDSKQLEALHGLLNSEKKLLSS